jgi:hypothetical protein
MLSGGSPTSVATGVVTALEAVDVADGPRDGGDEQAWRATSITRPVADRVEVMRFLQGSAGSRGALLQCNSAPRRLRLVQVEIFQSK